MNQSGINAFTRLTNGSILLITLQLFLVFICFFAQISTSLLVNHRMKLYKEQIERWQRVDDQIFRYLQLMDVSVAYHQLDIEGVVIIIQLHQNHYFEVIDSHLSKVLYHIYYDESNLIIEVEVIS